MDWQHLTREIEFTQTLPDEGLRGYLRDINQRDPELGQELTRHLSRNGRFGQFMQTSADALEADIVVPLQPNAEIDVWRITQFVGNGGMGEVYLAERCDGLYEQTVALKVMRQSQHGNQQRFNQERQRLAEVNHPGISRIIDGGTTTDGRPYMVMEFVDGQPIDDHIEQRGLSVHARLRLFVELCDAVSHVHANFILHRDLKTSNIMVDVEGKVRLIDFGVAALLDDKEIDQSGPLTIAYAAPEQLMGQSVAVTTDIFALGIVLNKMLTAQVPLRQPDGSVTVDTNALHNLDIAAIVTRATAFEPAARYDSVALLREDVASVWQHRPVSARQGGALYRTGKFLRRNPLASGLATAFVITLLTGMITSLLFAEQANTQAQRAQSALEESQFHLRRAERWLNAQSAYADALQHLFGGDADVEQQTQILLNVWRKAHNTSNKNTDEEEHTAMLAYSIGRHFVFRNDYPSALQILEPWMAADYGSADIRMMGRHQLAIAYKDVGKTEQAIPLLRELVEWYRGSYEANTADYVAAATQLARATLNKQDLLHAENLLTLAVEHERDELTAQYFLSQLGAIRQTSGKFEEAYQILRQLERRQQEHSVTEISGRNTAVLNLAYFELYYRKDLVRAEAMATAVLSNENNERGLNREVGRALTVLAILANQRGELKSAEAKLRQALQILQRYSGAASDPLFETVAALSEVLADRGQFETAQALLKEHSLILSAKSSRGYSYHRLSMAQIYVTTQHLGALAAQAHCDQILLDVALVARNPALVFYQARLENLGVKLQKCLQPHI